MVIEVLQNETDRQIIDYVFEYADNDMTRSEIAESVGVSKQYICKRIIAIKELLRKNISSNGMKHPPAFCQGMF